MTPRTALVPSPAFAAVGHLNHYTTESGRPSPLPALHVGSDAARHHILLITMGDACHVTLPT